MIFIIQLQLFLLSSDKALIGSFISKNAKAHPTSSIFLPFVFRPPTER